MTKLTPPQRRKYTQPTSAIVIVKKTPPKTVKTAYHKILSRPKPVS